MLAASLVSASVFERLGTTRPVTIKVMANAKIPSTRASSLFLEIFGSIWSSIGIVPHASFFPFSPYFIYFAREKLRLLKAIFYYSKFIVSVEHRKKPVDPFLGVVFFGFEVQRQHDVTVRR